ncbi:hypothetical protein BABINDRAFT_50631 [Babjeviella inositovora NRRL Y-12698]|uniref:peptidylprolyl isomerase n=1 Tax=Babjeviella inositovora NRRL Y-12698 TaxID=984486 RepID=A0A1E3QRT9_9ASCO|nr:uncharacterized protein BABINDRAFT_50631 [Babjeviella inositovora NRRL Y-12698]ODQ79657.1 hypothetical protein BABINDRAFT_50631 [Babjeviella inositovora NRRL Y-12698]
MPNETKRKTENDSSSDRKKPKNVQALSSLKGIPNRKHYRHSYPQSSAVTCLSVASGQEIVALGTATGVVTFWARDSNSAQLEVAKSYSTHAGRKVRQIVYDKAGKLLVSMAEGDASLKMYELSSLDMINDLPLPFTPGCIAWFEYNNKQGLVVSDSASADVYLLDLDEYQSDDEDDQDRGLVKISPLHKFPVVAMAFNYKYSCMVSVDSKGMMEYWAPDPDANYAPPTSVFKLKSQTNLYDLRKAKAWASDIQYSPDYERLVVRSTPDEYIRVFDFQTGKTVLVIDESVAANKGSYDRSDEWLLAENLSQLEFNAKVKTEADSALLRNVAIDETGDLLMYATLVGIKVYSIKAGQCVRVLGVAESLSFEHVVIVQSSSFALRLLTIEMASATNDIISKEWLQSPMLISTASNKDRIYVFDKDGGEKFEEYKFERDSFVGAQQDVKGARFQAANAERISQNTIVTLHTSMGDIRLKLYPQFSPLASTNFLSLCKKNYYDNVIFHRVIKGFMLQTGDPTGTGTGGESSFKDGAPFKDEFTPLLRHNKPFVLSMANAGANTNGSQFFITTAKAPWLDDKHTIFGEVVSGEPIVKEIENLEVDGEDRPHDPPVILNTSIEE